MKRVLFALLLAALSPSASAQESSVGFRQGDVFRGPVRSVRVEHATFSRVDGRLVEGPRRLLSVSVYAPDGRRREKESYAPDGSVSRRHVYVYDARGNLSRLDAFRWSAEAGEYEPYSVSYYTVEYYR